MDQPTPAASPIINCHTHIFTVKDVPPFIGKSILPWPFSRIKTKWIVSLATSRVRRKEEREYEDGYKKKVRRLYQIRMAIKRRFVLRTMKSIVFIVFLASVFHDQYFSLIRPWMIDNGLHWRFLDGADRWLANSGLIIITSSWLLKSFLLLVFLILFPSGRNLLFFVLKQVNRFVKLLPGKQTTELLKRYVNIARFAVYHDQADIFGRLKRQYPPGTKLVILPMDMAFMGAGKPEKPYHRQMQELAKIKATNKDVCFPFIFVDPRRTEAGGKVFFSYKVEGNKVNLLDCFIKDYIEGREDEKFNGFKIYPALGYFPFDERLLPLWKYAADHNIPIMTHCIRGVIYYRGEKKKAWDYHPLFEECIEGEWKPMLLTQMKQVDVQEIFTHPLNYACLYEKDLLMRLVGKAKDDNIRKLFGYEIKDGVETMTEDLEKLKICFGHFGGEDEWARFFDNDRGNYGHQIAQNPTQGITFLHTNGDPKPGKLAELWRKADWYSIICSLMLQHKSVFADISYILHGDQQILPLLRSTLQNDNLNRQVLYGTDFYVVRNHKSEKNMLADIRGGLGKELFDLIARENPVNYLS